MKNKFYFTFLVLYLTMAYSCMDGGKQEKHSEEERTYQQIHQEAIVIDGHNDFLYTLVDSITPKYTGLEIIDIGKDLSGVTHLDLARQREGGLDVQFFSVFCFGNQSEPFEMAMRQIDSLEVIAKRYPEKVSLVSNTSDMHNAIEEKKLVAMIGVEGGHMIEDDLDKLETLYERGARYMTLTWESSTSWATSSYDEEPEVNLAEKGLTDFGREVVQKMNELGMLVDISHVGEQTFWDVMETTTKPVIASHSSVYNLSPANRNLKDEQLKAIAENEGLVMVCFYPGFIDPEFWDREAEFFEIYKKESDSLMSLYNDDYYIVEYLLYRKYPEKANEIKPSLSKLIDHIDYITKLVGVDHVGLGSDFDGISLSIEQLDDVSDLPLITRELLERGYAEEDVRKILGENMIRVLRANEVK